MTDDTMPAIDSGNEDTELGRAVASWRGHEFIVKRNGKWCLDGFFKWHIHGWEIVRARDPNAPSQPPSYLFDPAWIARMYRIPEEELGIVKAPEVLEVLDGTVRKLDGAVARLEKLLTNDITLGLSDTQEMLLRAASETEPLGLPSRTVAEVIEPFLVRSGLMLKDDGGRRQLTARAREHLANCGQWCV